MAQATYDKLIAGATSHEIAVVQANVNQARTNYQNALEEFEDVRETENENLSQAQDRLQDLLSQTINDLTSQEQAIALAQTSFENTKSTYGQALENREETLEQTIETNISVATYALDVIDTMLTDDWIKSGLGLKDSTSLFQTKEFYEDGIELRDELSEYFPEHQNGEDFNLLIEKDRDLLNKTFSVLNEFYNVLENSVTTLNFPQNDLDTKKSSVNTQITTVSNAITSLQTAEQNLDDAEIAYTTNVNLAEENLRQAEVNLDDAITNAKNNLNSVKVAVNQKITLAQSQVDSTEELLKITEAELAKIQAPATSQDVALQKAQVNQAKAALAAAENTLEKSILEAPIEGTITKIDYEVGEMVTNEPVVSMLNGNSLEIEVDISETDISKVSLGDAAEITLDAFTDDDKFYGFVVEIEPAETVIQDVIYYKVKVDVEFGEDYIKQIKPGMTADVTITTALKENVLIVPSRAIVDRNGSGKFLRVLENGVLVEKSVEVVLRGDDGIIEILSDIAEGTEVVTYVKD